MEKRRGGVAAPVAAPCARALQSFNGQGPHELTFDAGVSILLLRRVDENWLEGKLQGRIGIFPAKSVRVEVGSPSLAQESALARSGRPYAVALQHFPASLAGDLALQKGQLVELLGRAGNGWLRGKDRDGGRGIFPASFVEILKSLPPEEGDEASPPPSFRPQPKPRRGVAGGGAGGGGDGKGRRMSLSDAERELLSLRSNLQVCVCVCVHVRMCAMCVC